MKTIMLVGLALFLSGCGDSPEEIARKEYWNSGRLVKICRDGTRIYRMKDGRYFTGGLFPNLIEFPETVCAGD